MLKQAIVGIVVALALAALAAPSYAQGQNKAAAEAAFRKGKDLIAAGKVADACAAFDQSFKLDAQLGTQYNLALCYQRLGKLASAWATFTELAARDSNAGRKADSAKRARALEPRLTRMIIRVAEPVPGLVLTQDGADVTLLIGTETPVDAGSYQFAASAPGRRPWTQPVAIAGEGKTVTVDIPVLDIDETKLDKPGLDADQRVPPPDDDDADAPVDPARGKTRRLIGLGVGGAGLLSVAVGAYFGIHASGLKSDADDLCGGSTKMCTGDVEASKDKVDSARTSANLSTGFVIVGVAALAGGAYLYFTAPSGGSESATALAPVLDRDQVGFSVSGRF